MDARSESPEHSFSYAEGVFRSPSSLFRAVAIAEMVSWTLLIAGLVVRATTGWAPAVTIGGGVHGFVFLSYGATVLLVAAHNRWRAAPTAVALASAIIPYATLPMEVWLHRRGFLDGAWRTGAGGTAREGDRRWYDGALTWLLRHPGTLLGAVLVAVAVVFTILLVIGPPGGSR